MRRKERRLAPFEMTVWCGRPGNKKGTIPTGRDKLYPCPYLDQGGVTPDMRA
jgi:hypothetical protein